VLVVPLMFSVYGGSALLGLGDIILPGLLVSFSIRYDYCKGTPLSRGFFCVATIAYAVGLLLANAMAIALRDVVAGQPALMYIVPIMLASVLGLAKHRGEFDEMWDGPPCLEMAAIDSQDGDGEREPLLQRV
jgi:signal peptide peptidase-like protein 2B